MSWLDEMIIPPGELEQLVAMAFYWQDVGFDAAQITPRQAWELCHAKDAYLEDARRFVGALAQ